MQKNTPHRLSQVMEGFIYLIILYNATKIQTHEMERGKRLSWWYPPHSLLPAVIVLPQPLMGSAPLPIMAAFIPHVVVPTHSIHILVIRL